MKRYYFDTENSAPDSVCNDHCGNIRGARTIAHKVANELNEVVYINDCETNDIVESVFPDSILDETSEPVENPEPDSAIEPVENSSYDISEPDTEIEPDKSKTTLTPYEIGYLLSLLESRIAENQVSISRLINSTFHPDVISDRVSYHEKLIEECNLIYTKLDSLYK